MIEHKDGIRVCVKSHRGLKRPQNEDSFQIVHENGGGCDVDLLGRMFAVADGMGGHAGGRLASRTACEGLLEYYSAPLQNQKGPLSVREALDRLEQAFWGIEKRISLLGGKIEAYEHMGTTLSVLLLFGTHALIAHVGDSRIYRFREGLLEQLTEDETVAQLSVEMGLIRQEEVPGNPLSHVLTQALGQGIDEVHTRVERVRPGDTFLICSDGLYDMVEEGEIRGILDQDSPLEGVCERLVNAALQNGGADNVTVIVVRIERQTGTRIIS